MSDDVEKEFETEFDMLDSILISSASIDEKIDILLSSSKITVYTLYKYIQGGETNVRVNNEVFTISGFVTRYLSRLEIIYILVGKSIDINIEDITEKCGYFSTYMKCVYRGLVDLDNSSVNYTKIDLIELLERGKEFDDNLETFLL